MAGFEAPVHISWARLNDGTLIRVPRVSNPEATRLELRCPDPSCNPYLAFAVMLAAGLDGIRRDLPVPPANEQNVFAAEPPRRSKADILPGSLNQALDALEGDEVVRAALGPHICERFITAKRLEWEDFRLDVSAWEINKYLPTY
jgi:glutamine synthetase